FLWAPAFDFPRVPGAVSYRFFVRTVEGGTLSFEAKESWAPLTPVWAQVPVGSTSLTVEALDRKSQPIGTAGKRQFHRGRSIQRSVRRARYSVRPKRANGIGGDHGGAVRA